MPKTNPQIVQKANCLNKNYQNPNFLLLLLLSSLPMQNPYQNLLLDTIFF